MQDTLPAIIAQESAASQASRAVAARWITPLSAAVGAALLALALRLFELWRHPFDGLYGQDPYFYLARAKILADILAHPDKLLILLGGGSEAFGTWPLGYMFQSAALFPLLGQGPLAGQVVNISSGALTAAWVALLAGWVLRGRVGGAAVALGALVAGLALAFGAVHLRGSLMLMSDVSGLHWAVLGVLLAVVATEQGGRRGDWLALAGGLALGLASITRYQYPLLLLPLALYWAISYVETRSISREQLRRIGLVLVGALLLIGWQQWYNLTHPLDIITSPVLDTWSPANFFGTTFNSPDGTLSYHYSMATYFFAAPPGQWQLFGPGLALAALVGAFAMLRARLWRWLALLGSWWLAYALFFSGQVYQADRFILSYLPPLAVFAGYGVAAAWRVALNKMAGTTPRLLGAGLLLLALANLLFMARGAGSLYAAAQAVKENDLRTVAAVQRYEDTGAYRLPVISFGLTPTLIYYTDLPVTELWFLRPATAAVLLSGRPRDGVRALLALPPGDLATQWRGMPMYDTYTWLTTNYHLVDLGPAGGYNLYEIR